MNKSSHRILFLLLALMVFVQCQKDESHSVLSWPPIKTEHMPGTYWWWMGGAVDKENLTYNLETLRESGIGNVHIIPIYGVEGEEENYIEFLSKEWMELLKHTIVEASRMKMNVDMSSTTGWPFGGSHVTESNAAKKLEYKKYSLSYGEQLNEVFNPGKTVAIMAYSEEHQTLNLTSKLKTNGEFNWIVPKGEWDVYVLCQYGTEQQVKRAAPGNIGLVLDPFSDSGLEKYLTRYDKAFMNIEEYNLRAQYHDSYEYYNANWTEEYLKAFKGLNHYDLLDYLPQLLDNDSLNVRVISDYRRTLAELHLSYIENWTDWAHSHGWLTRNEAHGAPGNLLDLYAASDIPETETFGARKLKIPGINYDKDDVSESVPPNPLILKFASSAANVTGKRLIASETCTWLREHFKTSLTQIKPQIDELFLSGINHIFYHGNAYSPKEAEWPGWIFYASTHFEKENSIWKDIYNLNSYITRCQSLLQESQPDNDILLYWPIEDIYHSYSNKLLKQLSVHDIDWFTDSEFGKLAQMLSDDGYSFDYISDQQLKELIVEDGNIFSNNSKYKVVVVPSTNYMSLETLSRIQDLSDEGATIIFQNSLPKSFPGYSNFEKRNSSFEKTGESLRKKNKVIEDKKIIISDEVQKILRNLEIRKEEFNSLYLSFIRKKHSDGYIYFLSNFSNKKIEAWIPLVVEAAAVGILDPRYDDKVGIAKTRKTSEGIEVFLQIEPGESIFLKTSSQSLMNQQKWNYSEQSGTTIELRGEWKIEFIDGGPSLPTSYSTSELKSWTLQVDSTAQRFAGTAKYTLSFDLQQKNYDDYILDLGKVGESARIVVNNNFVGTLWSVPFRISIGKYLKFGKNILEIEVTNLSANRIRYLDRRGIEWKKFFFVNVHYKNFDATKWPIMDSGLLGPVTLTPVSVMDF